MCIRDSILPKENEADLEDIPEEVAENLTFHPVEDLDSVIRIALMEEGVKTRAKGKSTSSGGRGKTPAKKKAPGKKVPAKKGSGKEIRA